MDLFILDDCKFATQGGIVVREFKSEDIVSDLSDTDALRMVELEMAVVGVSAKEIDSMDIEEVEVVDKPKVEQPKKKESKKKSK